VAGTRKDLDPADETARLLATLIKLQTESQSEAILELKKAGFGMSRIAELLGTTLATVNVAIQRSKAPSKPKAKKAKAKAKAKKAKAAKGSKAPSS
jgi:DNA-binding protein H-NS